MMAGLEALVEDVEPEPVAVFEPEEATKAPAAQQESDAPDAPAANTASSGGRLDCQLALWTCSTSRGMARSKRSGRRTTGKGSQRAKPAFKHAARRR